MLKVSKVRILAEENLYKSVVTINKNIQEEAKSKNQDYLTFGVKNTGDIPMGIVNKLRNNPKYLLATVDKMSHIGRSIDTDLINPITYRVMTGSSSGTAINIIKGINDFGICTDGGGSVLAPALSCNLYSFIGSGVGLTIEKQGVSTDNISFVPGIGVIANTYENLKSVVEDLLDVELVKDKNRKIRVAIPKINNLKLPDNTDMREEIDKITNRISTEEFKFIEYYFDNIYDRNISMKELENIFKNDIADIVLTYEGPIDVYGYDETIQRSFKGKAEKEITSNGGKGIIKAANMCKCTAITIPGDKLASGFVICAKSGMDQLKNAFNLADNIQKNIVKPEVFNRYFIRKEKFVKPFIMD